MSTTAVARTSRGGGAVARHDYSIAEMKEMATVMAQSRMLPGWDSAEKIMTLMLLCKDEGTNVTTAVLRYDNIQGRISKRASAMLDDFLEYGGAVDWIETSDRIQKAMFRAPKSEKWVTVEYTWNDAVRAQLTNKDNWKKYPSDMLRSRLISKAMRMVYPKATGLFYTPEEVMDMEPINVTPKGEPAKALFSAEPISVQQPEQVTREEADKAIAQAEVEHEAQEPEAPAVVPEVLEPEAPKPPAQAEPAKPKKQTDEIQEYLATFDQAKLAKILDKLKWKIGGLTSAQAKMILTNKPAFEKRFDDPEWVG